MIVFIFLSTVLGWLGLSSSPARADYEGQTQNGGAATFGDGGPGSGSTPASGDDEWERYNEGYVDRLNGREPSSTFGRYSEGYDHADGFAPNPRGGAGDMEGR